MTAPRTLPRPVLAKSDVYAVARRYNHATNSVDCVGRFKLLSAVPSKSAADFVETVECVRTTLMWRADSSQWARLMEYSGPVGFSLVQEAAC